MNQVRTASVPFFVKPITAAIANRVYENYLKGTYAGNFGYLEGLLEKQKYFAGDEFSAADALLHYPLSQAGEPGGVVGYGREMYPRIFDWLDRVEARAAYKRAFEAVSTRIPGGWNTVLIRYDGR